ncbi:MAG: DUF3318 domain-containing protein [Oscillatoriales cyanobacterium SM2_2_1]|nr:DUF3318 domain-containing protein [Oscillatoriales cyanobacterium SM2_2_1]
MNHSGSEIARLKDLLPASWRMNTIVQAVGQTGVIGVTSARFPWQSAVEIGINFPLWQELTLAQRDLVFLRSVAWGQEQRLYRPGRFQAVTLLAVLGGIAELAEGDLVGVAIAVLLAGVGGSQVWRQTQGSQAQLAADQEAIALCQRRGYQEQEAAQALLGAIPLLAKLEGRSTPDFVELIRCQNLRAIAGLSRMTVPTGLE